MISPFSKHRKTIKVSIGQIADGTAWHGQDPQRLSIESYRVTYIQVDHTPITGKIVFRAILKDIEFVVIESTLCGEIKTANQEETPVSNLDVMVENVFESPSNIITLARMPFFSCHHYSFQTSPLASYMTHMSCGKNNSGDTSVRLILQRQYPDKGISGLGFLSAISVKSGQLSCCIHVLAVMVFL